MVDAAADRALEALLASAADTAPAPARRVTLDERVELYLRAVHGAKHEVTAGERALARRHILAAMAAAIAETGTAGGELPASGSSRTMAATGTAVGHMAAGRSAPVWLARILNAVRRTTRVDYARVSQPSCPRLSRASTSAHAPGETWMAGTSPAMTTKRLEFFPLRGVSLAAAPLLLLIVAGALWHHIPLDPAAPPAPEQAGTSAPPPSARATRSLSPSADPGAEEQLKRQVALAEARSAGHPDVADALVRLADFYRAQGRHGAAAVHYERALAIREAALGPTHPATGEARERLAASQRVLGRPPAR
jgi:hypothetical protein